MKEIQKCINELQQALRFKGDAESYANNMMDVVKDVIKQLQNIVDKK